MRAHIYNHLYGPIFEWTALFLVFFQCFARGTGRGAYIQRRGIHVFSAKRQSSNNYISECAKCFFALLVVFEIIQDSFYKTWNPFARNSSFLKNSECVETCDVCVCAYIYVHSWQTSAWTQWIPAWHGASVLNNCKGMMWLTYVERRVVFFPNSVS